jgi:hypothetical protein
MKGQSRAYHFVPVLVKPQNKITERLNNVGSKIKDYSVFKDWESDSNIKTDE